MTRYSLLYAACIGQAGGLFLLRRAGFFANASRRLPLSPALGAALVLYGAGCLCMLVFALRQRHFLLLAGQLICTLLCLLGAARGKAS